MNSTDSNAYSVPPRIAAAHAPAPNYQLPGENPEEREPITSLVGAIDAILRQPRRVMYQLRQPGAGRLTLAMLFAAIGCSLVYGLVVGTFSMGTQLWAAPAKIASGLVISALICLPSLYISWVARSAGCCDHSSGSRRGEWYSSGPIAFTAASMKPCSRPRAGCYLSERLSGPQ